MPLSNVLKDKVFNKPPLRLAVFASGTGTNFQAIVKAIHAGELNAVVTGLITNNPDAGALLFARKENIPHEVINKKVIPNEHQRTARILTLLDEWKTELVVLAGYMKKICTEIVKKYRNRIVNIHPALLPSFGGKGMYGLNVHKAALDYGVKYSGVTVHIVNDEYDAGPVVLQRVVEVLDNDTPETLQKRILKEEHRAYKEVIKYFSENRVKVNGRHVSIQRNNAKD